MTTEFAFLDWPGPIAFAHRGGASEAPENTMPAFAHAVALGYHYLETDVHVTADGVLLAFHDDVLDRVTDGRGRVDALPYAVVKAAKVDGREPIPRFEDLLGAWPDVRVNVDPKHDSAVEALAEVLRRCNAVDRVCIGAFSDHRLARMRSLVGPRLCTSLGPRNIAKLRTASYRVPVGRLPAPCAQVPTAARGITIVDARFLTAARARDVRVHVWTIDDRDEMVRLLDLGVDGIMTDRPAMLREVLESRGEWVT
ncbi:MAG TPA: glycerophosphodiester phosphodiesterase [Acidimicrobiales bacterium]|jgi:glycerophosphoryl diester phosphodiesterase|nr:glycerophosphodiester phosphodiesterase [Acidimicrobiales bacterium]